MTAEVEGTRWAVLYRRGRVVEVWAVIEGVDVDTRPPVVRAAVEQSARWPVWQARRGIEGVVTVSREDRWGTARAAIERALVAHNVEVIQWASLAAAERRISVAVSSELWASCRRRAAAAGVSLAEWVRWQLAAGEVEQNGTPE